MIDPSDILDELKPRSPSQVIEDAVSLGRVLAAHGRPRPELELSLQSGQTLRGRAIDFGETPHHGPTIVLVTGGTPRTPSVAYVPISRVIAVVIDDASVLVRPPVSDAPAPNRLTLARQIAARGEPLTARLGRPIAITVADDLDDAGRRAVGAAIPVVLDALLAIAGDELGRDALAKLTAVTLTAGSAPELAITGDTLAVRAPVLLADAYTVDSLRRELEKLL
jgi:hypothetical protein